LPAALKRSFAPVVDEGTRVLLLGSLPGEQSLALGQYYGNPRNQFWKLMEAVTGAALEALPYPARLEALLGAGVGLWDVVETASRAGSLDAAIRNHRANSLSALAASLPALRAIAFNGGTSARLGMKALGPDVPWALVPLPSSSPAFTLPFAEKRERWLALSAFLDTGGSLS
jgi:hypoxanthine-DNA glycosylase